MKTIYLLRHAHAEDKNVRADFSRTLDESGKREARKTGAILKSKNIAPQLILSSSAERTMETSAIVAKELNYPADRIVGEERLYSADESDYLDFIQKTDNSINSLMLTGHNPGISGLAQALTGTFNNSMSTSSTLVVEFDVRDWKDIRWRKGHFVEYIEP